MFKIGDTVYWADSQELWLIVGDNGYSYEIEMIGINTANIPALPLCIGYKMLHSKSSFGSAHLSIINNLNVACLAPNKYKCECGKEKHKFANHAYWCEMFSEINSKI